MSATWNCCAKLLWRRVSKKMESPSKVHSIYRRHLYETRFGSHRHWHGAVGDNGLWRWDTGNIADVAHARGHSGHHDLPQPNTGRHGHLCPAQRNAAADVYAIPGPFSHPGPPRDVARQDVLRAKNRPGDVCRAGWHYGAVDRDSGGAR